MRFSAVIASIAVVSATTAPAPNYHMILQHQKMVQSMNGTAIKDSSFVSRAATVGSVVYSFHADGDTCQKQAGSGNGYVFGGCVSVDGSTGIYYSDCSESGGKTNMSFTSCTSGDCSKGCTSYPIVSDTCSSGMKTSCSNKADSYSDFSEFTYHYEFFYGESSCSGSYDMWSAFPMACTSAYNAACSASATTNYASQGLCDL